MMMRVTEEWTQSLYGITNGCASCGTRDFKDDIRLLQIRCKYGGSGTDVVLCRKCREELGCRLLLSVNKEEKEEKQ